ncbi:MAG TPA: hypothetical protein VEW92_09445, partial [Nitrososphaeraceae archaeon]|nr:hypothetical protein [Nitrososphaeraceae archaeon]
MIQKVNNNGDNLRKNNITFFENAYSSAVKEGMKILGEDVSKIVQDYIEDKYSFLIENTSQDPKSLSDALQFAIDGG